MSDAFDLDFFVIGGGSGGVRAARIASQHGARVALAEEYRMGGTCVIRGCVPKKLMVFASELRHVGSEAPGYGWEFSDGTFHWDRFAPRMRAELDRLEGIYRRNLANAGVTLHDQRAVVVDPHTVELADGTRLTASHILIATGGTPVRPAIEGAELGITSNDIFLMDKLPGRILIIGGGYIACEFACILNGLGVDTTQFYRGPEVLRGFDRETADIVAGEMRAQGVDLRLETNITKVERTEGGLRVTRTDGGTEDFDQVLFATGRAPNTTGLGLEGAGLTLAGNGAVPVDDYSQTAVPSIFAVGDVTDRIALTPVAIREGHALADTLFGNAKRKMDHDLVPSAVFTQPEMGTVGMTEEEASARGPIDVYTTHFRPMRTAFADRPDREFYKLIVDAQSDRILGAHVIGAVAGELIQMIGVAVKMGATKADFDATCAVHPTASEELVTMHTPTRTTRA